MPTKTPTRKRRRKKKFYKTGVFQAVKCKQPIKYRSSWELVVAKFLDYDDTVLKFEYENMKVPYISNRKTMKIRHYIPDFFVEYKDGRKVIIEVKPSNKLTQIKVVKKAEAIRYWANSYDIEYVFWTEITIKELKKILKD
jgi:hypothetical protein